MARPITTDPARVKRTDDRRAALASALSQACAHGAPASLSDTDVCYCAHGASEGITERECATDAWAAVAGLAGNVQRDARMLAGLGRGG